MRTPDTRTLINGFAVLALLLIAAVYVCGGLTANDELSGIGGGVAMAAAVPVFGRLDASLIKTKALPEAAGTGTATETVYTDAIDTMKTEHGHQLANVEYEIVAPALVVGDLANGDTMTYDVQVDDDAEFGSATTLIAGAIVQTGAGGAGAAAATYRFRLPHDCPRYVRVAATNNGNGDASDKSVTFQVRF